MSNVLPIRPIDPIAALARRVALLEADRDVLFDVIDLLMGAVEAHLDHVDGIEARLPPPRFEVPPGWITIGRAAGQCGYSEESLYRWVRTGAARGVKVGGRVFVDPSSLSPTK